MRHSLFKTVISIVLASFASSAFAEHIWWSKRAGVQDSNYWQNDLQLGRSRLEEPRQTTEMTGSAMRAAYGAEYDNWVRVAGFGLYRAASTGKNDSLVGASFGLDLSVSFESPVLNINFGLLGSVGGLNRQADNHTYSYFTRGVGAHAELERFVAERMSITAGFTATRDLLLSPEVDSQSSLSTQALGVGLSIWLY